MAPEAGARGHEAANGIKTINHRITPQQDLGTPRICHELGKVNKKNKFTRDIHIHNYIIYILYTNQIYIYINHIYISYISHIYIYILHTYIHTYRQTDRQTDIYI